MNAIESFALQVAIGGLGVSALALLVVRLLRRRSEPLRYGILLTGVIGLLAVPALVGLGRLCQSALPAAEPGEEILRLPADMLPALLARAGADAPEAEPDAPVGWFIVSAIVALWSLGCVFGLLRLVRALVKQRRAIVGEPWCPAFWTDERRADLARKLGLRRFPEVYLSPAAPMPMVIGIWRPTIVLPEAAPPAWQQPQWEAVLLHEAAHIARGDPWAVLAQRLAVALYWWCPLVYVLARRLDALRENICDDCALEGCGDRIAYAELLVDSAEHFLRLTTLGAPLGLIDSARGGLEARVSRLLQTEKPSMTRLSLPGKILGALCLVAVGLVTTGGTAFSGGQDSQPRKVHIKIIIDGKEIDLGDPQLWRHIEEAQKKAPDAVRVEAARALQAIGGDKAAHRVAIKELAFSPDGRLITSGDGKHIVVIDATTGRVIAQHDKAKPASGIVWLQAQQQGQGKADPRIEALVKQAEAIKPGSGDTIRKALQGGPNPKEARFTTGNIRLWDATSGKQKTIVVEVGDGKTLRLNLNAEELHKLLDKGAPLRLHLELPQVNIDTKVRDLVQQYKVVRDKAPAAKPATPPPPADLEALSRQLERLSVELNELRRRLEANKK